MIIEGGCYCGEVRYRAKGEPMFKGECFCRECQYISGGNSNLVMAMPAVGFAVTKGEPKAFVHSGLEAGVSREFCSTCGTHLFTRAPAFKAGVIVKIGTFDDPALYGGAQMAIQIADKFDHHRIPDDIPVFERWSN
jgi:hypothetical protein